MSHTTLHASHSPLNVLETVKLGSKGNGLWIIKWSHDRWRHVAPKGQTRDPNTLRAQYLENSWRWNLAIIANV